jgi:uncharacterized protein
MAKSLKHGSIAIVLLNHPGAPHAPIVVRSTTRPENGASVEKSRQRIQPRSGTAFELKAGQMLTVIDPEGEQVADLLAFNAHDKGEVISSGRTLDYAGKIYLTTGDPLYSNRSQPMLDIVDDSVGRHDFLLAPCSKDRFRIIDGDADPHHGCFGNLVRALSAHWIKPDAIPVAFSCFANLTVDTETGALRILAPVSKAGDVIRFRAHMDLIIGLTACSAKPMTNSSCKPIDYLIE